MQLQPACGPAGLMYPLICILLKKYRYRICWQQMLSYSERRYIWARWRWQMKQLIDRAAKLWMEGALEGKVGGVFATGGGFGGAGGGVEQTMIALHSNFLEHGMLVVGFPKSLPGYADGGLQWGPYGRSGNHEGIPDTVSDSALTAARSYGSHLVEVASKINA